MNFDVGTVQCKCLNSFNINGLRLEFLFDKIEDAEVDPTPKTPINREPVTDRPERVPIRYKRTILEVRNDKADGSMIPERAIILKSIAWE